ncbi:hypothetical protein BT96DRAFT_999219 [Gymnopus androsaceus JB14]|uniref:DUF4412 domain-containing protein n=1 Tax=Gymnopus androsaceus JB14 TaxID=1447944 RepID=A0A6A4H635_9AGAR|nr:hypothetical protein BT96DRAFT_999219 [Gymnopus androsaceus JB14]
MFNTLISKNFLLAFYLASLVCAVPVDPSSTRRELVARTSGKPMAKILYHGTSTRQCDQEKVKHSPSSMPTAKGDFSPVGGFYMFDDHTEAAWWGNMNRVTGTTKTFCVVELEYTESHEHKVYTFPMDDKDELWQKFLDYNNHDGRTRISPEGRGKTELYSIITGPMGVGYNPGKKADNVAEKSYHDAKGHMITQYVIVDKAALSTLKIKKMETYEFHEGWADAKPPASMPADIKLLSTKE